MPDHAQPNSEKDVPTNKSQKTVTITVAIVVTVALFGALAAIARFYVNEHSEKIKFLTDNTLNLLILLAIAVQAYISRRQWIVMEQHGLAQRGQLSAIKLQVEVMEGGLEETRKMVEHNKRVFDANQKFSEKQMEVMQGQLTAMEMQAVAAEAQFKATSILAEFSERSANAAEMSAQAAQHGVEVMKESSIATTRAYIGIREIAVGTLIVGKIPTVSVIWHNGGKTPASKFRASVYLIFGEKPEWRGYLLHDDWSDSKANFLPPGVSNPVAYSQAEYGFEPITSEMLDTLNGGSQRLYAMIEAQYRDFMDQPRPFETSYIFNPFEGTFTEL